jgi:hypothetical protein
MSEPVGATCVERDIQALHAHFLTVLPRIQTHAEIYFRHLHCPGRRDDAIQEVIAIAWKWFLRITEQGKNVDEFVMALADLAVRHVRSGRGLCGQERARDVLSSRAQRIKGFRVEALPACTRRDHERIYATPHGQHEMDVFEQRLADNVQTPVVEQVIFRLDFRQWVVQLGPRNREIAKDMALDLTTTELAQKYQISSGRVSQLRRELHLDWSRFHGEGC